jgi:hypothetical protein
MDKFFAQIVVRSEIQPGSKLEIEFSDVAGHRQTLCLSADAIAALAEIVSQCSTSNQSSREHLTKIPRHYAVGSGRHEPVVLLRFEDEHAYGLSPDQAVQLGEALLEEAEAMSTIRYSVRQ